MTTHWKMICNTDFTANVPKLYKILHNTLIRIMGTLTMKMIQDSTQDGGTPIKLAMQTRWADWMVGCLCSTCYIQGLIEREQRLTGHNHALLVYCVKWCWTSFLSSWAYNKLWSTCWSTWKVGKVGQFLLWLQPHFNLSCCFPFM